MIFNFETRAQAKESPKIWCSFNDIFPITTLKFVAHK